MKLTICQKQSFLLLALFCCTLACTDVEEELLDTTTFEEHFDDSIDFISAAGLAYRYLYFQMAHNGYFMLQEVSSDEAIIVARGFDWTDVEWRNLHQHNYQDQDFYLSSFWSDIYFAISSCNRIIDNFERSTNPEKNRFIAEVKILRALYYTWLMDVFGNVPIITSPTPEAEPEQASRIEVFNFIEQEILNNISLLDKSRSPATYAKMDYYAAQALLSSLYLNAEVYTGTPQWEKAIDACDAIINSGFFELENNFFDNFKSTNEGSIENIFVIPFESGKANGFNLHMMTLHPSSQQTFNLNSQPWNGYATLSEFYDSFEEQDIRKGGFFVGPQYTVSGQPLIDPFAEDEDPDGPQVNFTPNINFPSTLRQDGIRIGKYEIPLGANIDLNNDFPLFRYGEILLNKAEALWRLDSSSPEALVLTNLIRSRAGMADFESLTAEILLAERGRELSFECKRRIDLIRFSAFGNEWLFKPVSDPCKTIFPIPFIQLANNSKLSQNPCY
jgi:hypothetical protein